MIFVTVYVIVVVFVSWWNYAGYIALRQRQETTMEIFHGPHGKHWATRLEIFNRVSLSRHSWFVFTFRNPRRLYDRAVYHWEEDHVRPDSADDQFRRLTAAIDASERKRFRPLSLRRLR